MTDDELKQDIINRAMAIDDLILKENIKEAISYIKELVEILLKLPVPENIENLRSFIDNKTLVKNIFTNNIDVSEISLDILPLQYFRWLLGYSQYEHFYLNDGVDTDKFFDEIKFDLFLDKYEDVIRNF